MEFIRDWIEYASQGIEALAVAIIVVQIVIGTVRWIYHSASRAAQSYERYRVILGQSLLIGLELLVAADVIRTAALDVTLTNLGFLAALVGVRTFLGWTVTVEVEGRWPWQAKKESESTSKGES